MKHIFISIFIFLLGTIIPAQNCEWEQILSVDGKYKASQRISIEQDDNSVNIQLFDETGLLIRETCLDEHLIPLESRIYDEGGNLTLSITISEGEKVTAVSDEKKVSKKCSDTFLLSDDSITFAISQWFRQDPSFPEKRVFLYSAENNDFNKMLFFKADEGLINIGNHAVNTVRIDMKLSSSLARLFWPHVYSYWIASDDGRFLAYEGPDPDGATVRIEVSSL